MSVSVSTARVGTDHPEPVSPLGGTATVTVSSGDTVYYYDRPSVSASNNTGSLTSGQSASFTSPQYLISASYSSVQISVDDTQTATQLPSSVVNASSPGTVPMKNGSGVIVPGGQYAWQAYSGNPIIAAEAGSVGDGVAFMDVFWDPINSLFHGYYMVDGTSAGIYHATSADGLTNWQKDTGNPVLTKSASGWDANQVRTPTAWLEGSTVYLIYGDTTTGNIGIATAPLAVNQTGANAFTKYASNPIGASAPNSYVSGFEAGPGRMIKVGTTYWLFVSAITGNSSFANHRAVGLLKSTAGPFGPYSWAAATNGAGTAATDPIWANGSLCNSVWYDGSLYHALLMHMRSYSGNMEFQHWTSEDVRFPYWNRHYQGILRRSHNAGWENSSLDTPTIVCDDITRSSFNCTGGMPRLYYSGLSAGGVWLTGVLQSRLVPPQMMVDKRTPASIGPWLIASPAQSLTNQQMGVCGSAQSWFPLAQSGSIVSLAVNCIPNITAGNLTVAVTNAGGSQAAFSPGLAVTLTNGASTFGNQQQGFAMLDEGVWHFAAGDAVGVQISTAATLAPANINVSVSLGVVYV